MTFLSPGLLWPLVALPLIAFLLFRGHRQRSRFADRFAAERVRGVSNRLRGIRPYLLLTGAVALIFALAGPQAGFSPQTIPQPDENLIVLVDLSSSMAAEDFGQTSRLQAAKVLARLILEGHSGRVGLIAFEGVPELVSPLTTDGESVSSLLDSLSTGEIAEPGSDVGSAIEGALDMVQRTSVSKARLVLFSDGEDQGDSIDRAVRRAAGMKVPISTVLIGGTKGSHIPATNGVLNDEQGRPVITTAQPATMRKIADGTGGTFFMNPLRQSEVKRLVQSETRSDFSGRRTDERRVPANRFQWPLSVALLALFCGSVAHRGAE